jgi:hypothetical protein
MPECTTHAATGTLGLTSAGGVLRLASIGAATGVSEAVTACTCSARTILSLFSGLARANTLHSFTRALRASEVSLSSSGPVNTMPLPAMPSMRPMARAVREWSPAANTSHHMHVASVVLLPHQVLPLPMPTACPGITPPNKATKHAQLASALVCYSHCHRHTRSSHAPFRLGACSTAPVTQLTCATMTCLLSQQSQWLRRCSCCLLSHL